MNTKGVEMNTLLKHQLAGVLLGRRRTLRPYLKHQLADGSIARRSTLRPYTHVVVGTFSREQFSARHLQPNHKDQHYTEWFDRMIKRDGKSEVLGWSQSAVNAQKAAAGRNL